MFLLFGAMGAVVAIGSWVAQRVAARRKRRVRPPAHAARNSSYERGAGAEVERFASFVLATTPTMALAHSHRHRAVA